VSIRVCTGSFVSSTCTLYHHPQWATPLLRGTWNHKILRKTSRFYNTSKVRSLWTSARQISGIAGRKHLPSPARKIYFMLGVLNFPRLRLQRSSQYTLLLGGWGEFLQLYRIESYWYVCYCLAQYNLDLWLFYHGRRRWKSAKKEYVCEVRWTCEGVGQGRTSTLFQGVRIYTIVPNYSQYSTLATPINNIVAYPTSLLPVLGISLLFEPWLFWSGLHHFVIWGRMVCICCIRT